jgi:hypothetical protein
MKNKRKSKATSELMLKRALNTVLEDYYFPNTLETHVSYSRRQDDTDGELDSKHYIRLMISRDSDAWIIHDDISLRFRAPFGGGSSPRVRNALIVLAEAIRRDNEDRPQGKGEQLNIEQK